MGCCSGSEGDAEPDGACPECGEPTEDGQAVEWCEYSPVICLACGWAPCDGSC